MKKKEFELSLEGRVWFSYVSMLKSGERIPRQEGISKGRKELLCVEKSHGLGCMKWRRSLERSVNVFLGKKLK